MVVHDQHKWNPLYYMYIYGACTCGGIIKARLMQDISYMYNNDQARSYIRFL